MDATDEKPVDPKDGSGFIGNERKKFTATYLNVLAGSLFTAGVAAPVAAAVFGVTGAGAPIAALTLV